MTLTGMQREGVIRYIAFPGELKGKYQSYTQADLSALREAGYGERFLTVEEGVERYCAAMLRRADATAGDTKP
jgi:ADP-L-glycero-D-manno-heptose 6-epimerase